MDIFISEEIISLHKTIQAVSSIVLLRADMIFCDHEEVFFLFTVFWLMLVDAGVRALRSCSRNHPVATRVHAVAYMS